VLSLNNNRIDKEISMLAVTVSPKFQVVIPQAVREQLQITPGQKMQVISFDHRIELLPIEAPQKLRGFLSGIETTVSREDDRV
jgi:AbrB family looped-hinge helix DNA binding protein